MDHVLILLQTRPSGVDHGQHAERQSWKNRRAAKKEFLDSEPQVSFVLRFKKRNRSSYYYHQVIIVGAGQAGLTLAARLGQLNVDALILE